MHDLIVIGAGIMGAPTARHAACAGADVAVIGEPEPDSPADHHGLFGAWHDVTRLAARLHAHREDSELAIRSTDAILALEADGAPQILTPAGHLFAAVPGLDDGLDARLAADRSGIDCTVLDAGDLADRYPQLRFQAGTRAVLEGAPSGYIHPRRLVNAQLTAAAEAGAHVVPATVAAVEIETGAVTAVLADGRRITGRRAVLATGAFSNSTTFLPRPLALRLKTETVLLAEIDGDHDLGTLPPIHFENDDSRVGAIYTAPPVIHPDGTVLMKFGANTRHDRLIGRDQIGPWYRSGDSDAAIPDMVAVCAEMFPTLRAVAWHTARCVITYTPHDNPIIDTLVDGRLYAAVGGNGHSAKWCDGIGGLAARLALTNAWIDDAIGPDRFRVVYDDEAGDWAGPALIGDR